MINDYIYVVLPNCCLFYCWKMADIFIALICRTTISWLSHVWVKVKGLWQSCGRMCLSPLLRSPSRTSQYPNTGGWLLRICHNVTMCQHFISYYTIWFLPQPILWGRRAMVNRLQLSFPSVRCLEIRAVIDWCGSVLLYLWCYHWSGQAGARFSSTSV